MGVHSLINRAGFSGEGTGHFKSSGEQIWKSIGTNAELVRGVIGPIYSPNDDLRACLHGGGGPQVGEVTCLCGVKK